ncbi:hypothetical protein [Oribacterium sp. Sow4_G1_1]|uniref:hypothetical protein n=1 Tax=Oribacterium sp. Sow4_G1_1 TaxID=3438794 RepID=UPI003F9D60FC
MAKAVKPKKGKGLVKTLKENLEWYKNELRYEKKLVEQLKKMNDTKKGQIRALQTMLVNQQALLWLLIDWRGGSVEVTSEEWKSAIGKDIWTSSDTETNTFTFDTLSPSAEELDELKKMNNEKTEEEAK